MRKISSIVIHCSATREDKELTAFDLDTMHRRRGFNGTGYHYYIRKDGQHFSPALLSESERMYADLMRRVSEFATKAGWTAGDARQIPGRRNSGQHSGCWCISCKRNFPVAGCAVIVTCHRTVTGMERSNRKSGSKRVHALR